jgi:hypothetical protein
VTASVGLICKGGLHDLRDRQRTAVPIATPSAAMTSARLNTIQHVRWCAQREAKANLARLFENTFASTP